MVLPNFRLPYGEFLGEIEALHLIIAHDLYNELKSLIEELQRLGLCELPINLLVMMVAFFRGHPRLIEPGKVLRIHHYYMNTLKVLLYPGGQILRRKRKFLVDITLGEGRMRVLTPI